MNKRQLFNLNNAISANFTKDLLSGYICCKKILVNNIIKQYV